LRAPPTSTLFPYTTLFRSAAHERDDVFPAWRCASLRCRRDLRTRRRGAVSQSPAVGGAKPRIPRLLRLTGMAQTLMIEAVESLRSEEHTSELQSRFDLVCR